MDESTGPDAGSTEDHQTLQEETSPPLPPPVSDAHLLQPESDLEQHMTTAKAMVGNDGKWLSVPNGSSTRVHLCSALGSLVEDELDDKNKRSNGVAMIPTMMTLRVQKTGQEWKIIKKG